MNQLTEPASYREVQLRKKLSHKKHLILLVDDIAIKEILCALHFTVCNAEIKGNPLINHLWSECG